MSSRPAVRVRPQLRISALADLPRLRTLLYKACRAFGLSSVSLRIGLSRKPLESFDLLGPLANRCSQSHSSTSQVDVPLWRPARA